MNGRGEGETHWALWYIGITARWTICPRLVDTAALFGWSRAQRKETWLVSFFWIKHTGIHLPLEGGAKVQIHSFTALIRCLDNSAITPHKAAFQIILLLLLHDYKGKTQRQKHPGIFVSLTGCPVPRTITSSEQHRGASLSLSVRFTTWRLRTQNNHWTTLGRDTKIRVIVAGIACQCSWVNRQVLSQAGPWVERMGSPKG